MTLWEPTEPMETAGGWSNRKQHTHTHTQIIRSNFFVIKSKEVSRAEGDSCMNLGKDPKAVF